MGIIYKFKPEIKDFILEQKKANTTLSCRGLTSLVENKFQIKVSKSSINYIVKEAGLSMPVGRRLKKRRTKQIKAVKLIEFKPPRPIEIKTEELIEQVATEPVTEPVVEKTVVPAAEQKSDLAFEIPSESECSGAILLKAADYIMGGSYYIAEAAKSRLNIQVKDLLAKTESLIYLSFLGLDKEPGNKNLAELWALINKKIPLGDILSYRDELQSVKSVNLDIFRIISHTLQQVRCVKVNLVDGNTFYLDGQMHTIWSTPHIPHDFSSTTYSIKSYINKYLYEDVPFALFMAPGYDTPTKEFFYFLSSLNSLEKKISKLILYGNKFEELESILIEKAKRRFFIFGLWAWQFVEHRKVNKIGEFKPVYFEPLNKDFYVAEIEIELSQPDVKQEVTLQGCALKTNLSEKTRLIILTNLPSELASAERVANIYLNRWPNLEEAFKDYSAKVELFTYTGSSQRFLSPETLDLKENTEDLNVLWEHYLKALDLYVKWHLLPIGLEEEAFPTINERFYSLKANLTRKKDYYYVNFTPPSGFPFVKELEYACRRINEKIINISDGPRLWLRL